MNPLPERWPGLPRRQFSDQNALGRDCENSRGRQEDRRPRLSWQTGFQPVTSEHGRPEARRPSQPGRLFSVASELISQPLGAAALALLCCVTSLAAETKPVAPAAMTAAPVRPQPTL